MTAPIRILIVDDHAIVREGLSMLLSEEADIRVVAEATNGAQAIALAREHEPEVILLDIVMPVLDGLATIRELKAKGSTAAILVLTSFSEDGMVRQAIEAGALGYLLKDVSRSELLRAIRGARDGLPALHPEAQRQLMQQIQQPKPASRLQELTPREESVLREIASGKSNKEIAAALHLSSGTVKGYVSVVLEKLGVEDRTQAALLAVKEGLIRLDH